jgi:teichuronic acid biosynthesis glycosyltransferase TuaH
MWGGSGEPVSSAGGRGVPGRTSIEVPTAGSRGRLSCEGDEGDRGGLIVMAAASHWDGPRLADRHLAEHLGRRRPVLYIDPPISRRRASSDGRLSDSGRLRRVDTRLWVLDPVVLPAKDRLPVTLLTSLLVRRAVRRAVAQLGLPVHAVISSTYRPLLRSVAAAHRVYWVLDDYVAGAHLINLPRRRVARAVAARASEADDIVVVSPGLEQSFRAAGYEPELVPNGVDVEKFSVPSTSRPPDIDLSPPVVGYIGGMTDRIDPQMLRVVAERGWSLLLVGPLSRSGGVDHLRPILDMPNVAWLGERPFEEIPAYMASIDVGIIPYRVDGFNVASFPLKALEYLAAGREVVASDLPALRWLETDHIRLADGPTSFAEEVAQAVLRAGDASIEASCRLVAGGHGWADRAASFLRLIDAGLASNRTET